ncbi:VanW family protein [Aneurinibacillus terranovensis]|uniref:VanW family protein n=1 Tax=Aneurinibacillus terranovensis TaxID=278991 RepID=UPI000419A0D0|nr:VanW family protein [Aneurinibacillus terranovensis]
MLQRNYAREFMLVFLLLLFQLVIFNGISLQLSGEWKQQGKESPLYNGITIAGVEVGGLLPEEAETRVRQLVSKINAATLEITMDGKSYPVNKKDIQLAYDIAGTIQEAKNVSEESSGITAIWKKWSGTAPSLNIPLKVSYNRESLSAIINQIGKNVNRPAVPAREKVEENKITVIPEQEGYKVDVQNTLAMVQQELQVFQRQLKVPLVVTTDTPTVTRAMLQPINTLLSEEETTIKSSVPNRLFNVQRAAELLNGVVVNPQETFSFTKKIAPFSDTNGYTPVAILSDEDIQDGVAGGASQVASTLYIAAVKTHLPILERHNNARPVDYLPAGYDAFVNGKDMDLRFLNNGKTPIYIYAEAKSDRLHISIFGGKDQKTNVQITAKQLQTFSPDTIARPDETLAAGQEKIVRLGEKGVRVKVSISYTDKDGSTKQEALSDDFYKPLPNIIAVGPQVEGATPPGGNSANSSQQGSGPQQQQTEPTPQPEPDATSQGNSSGQQPQQKDTKDKKQKSQNNVIYLN